MADYKEVIEKINELRNSTRPIKKEDLDALYKLAIEDEKTPLHNYRFFSMAMEKAIQKAISLEVPFSLILIDADNFKQINDRFGHTKGDFVLEKIGRIIKASLRNEDIAGRFGGEEFMILLPGLRERQAKTIAERLRIRILADVFISNYEATISAGIAEFTGDLSNFPNWKVNNGYIPKPKEVLNEADVALKWAKEHGKNQCKAYSEI